MRATFIHLDCPSTALEVQLFGAVGPLTVRNLRIQSTSLL